VEVRLLLPPAVNVPAFEGEALTRIWQLVPPLAVQVFGLLPFWSVLLLKSSAVAMIATDWPDDRLAEPGGGLSGSMLARLLTMIGWPASWFELLLQLFALKPVTVYVYVPSAT
jgi:hypothetical protein